MKNLRFYLVGLLAASFVGAATAEVNRPTLVSLDYCADQFVLGLADRTQILALSKDAEKPFSHLRSKAEGMMKIRSLAEDVVALKPDIVVRSWGGDMRAMALFERLGIGTVQIGYASDISGAARITMDVANAFGQAERGAHLVGNMPPARDSVGKTAIYVTPGGVTAGQGTMVDAMMRDAGLSNAVREAGWRALPLEQLVLTPPAIAVTAFFGFDTDATDQWSAARHPVLQRILNSAETYPLRESRLTCPAWFVADEAAALGKAVR